VKLSARVLGAKNTEELKEDLNKFLIYYDTNTNLGGLTKKLKVRIP